MMTTKIIFDVNDCESNATRTVRSSVDIAGFGELREFWGVGPDSHFVIFYETGPRWQNYFWTPEWQLAERTADEDIAIGRTRLFHSVEDAITWLEEDKS